MEMGRRDENDVGSLLHAFVMFAAYAFAEVEGAALGECARVLASSGHLVLADLFSPLLVPTLLVGRRDRARTRPQAEALLKSAGFRTTAWHSLYRLIIGAVVASK